MGRSVRFPDWAEEGQLRMIPSFGIEIEVDEVLSLRCINNGASGF
jgi:hypothetical protein